MTARKKQYRLNDNTIDEIAAMKLPFSSKQYYAFTEKYLPKSVDEALYIDDDSTYYREIATDYDDLKLLQFVRQYIAGSFLCDVGCGIGNVLHFAAMLGYTAFGYDINTGLRRIHKRLTVDVLYGDLLSMGLTRMADANVIYLYRPIGDDKLMNRLLARIHRHTGPETMVIYNYPHTTAIRGYETIVLSKYDAHIILLVKTGARIQDKILARCELLSSPKKG
ncbi:MAG: hypothetical protein V4649_15220 [Bacteroidota bacterium]